MGWVLWHPQPAHHRSTAEEPQGSASPCEVVTELGPQLFEDVDCQLYYGPACQAYEQDNGQCHNLEKENPSPAHGHPTRHVWHLHGTLASSPSCALSRLPNAIKPPVPRQQGPEAPARPFSQSFPLVQLFRRPTRSRYSEVYNRAWPMNGAAEDDVVADVLTITHVRGANSLHRSRRRGHDPQSSLSPSCTRRSSNSDVGLSEVKKNAPTPTPLPSASSRKALESQSAIRANRSGIELPGMTTDQHAERPTSRVPSQTQVHEPEYGEPAPLASTAATSLASSIDRQTAGFPGSVPRETSGKRHHPATSPGSTDGH